MKKNNDTMEHPKVEQLAEQTGFEIVELDDDMLSNVIGGVPANNAIQCQCQNNCG